MEKIRHSYLQNCKKFEKIKTFKTIFNEFFSKNDHISYQLSKSDDSHKVEKKYTNYFKKHIKNIIFRNFISKIKSESQNITNISDQKIVKNCQN